MKECKQKYLFQPRLPESNYQRARSVLLDACSPHRKDLVRFLHSDRCLTALNAPLPYKQRDRERRNREIQRESDSAREMDRDGRAREREIFKTLNSNYNIN